mgnify:FL=1
MLLSPLSNRAYRHLFTAQVVALIGTGLTTVALSLLAYPLAGDKAGMALGIALALKMVAYVGIAPVVGGLAHRLPRRKLLVCLDLLRAGCVLCLPLVDALWQVYLLIFLLNACSAGFTPVFQATIPDVLPDEDDYTQALSLSRLAYDLESLFSPLLAAGALAVMSYHGLFTVNAVAFVASALLVVSVRLPAAAPVDRPRGIFGSILFGLHVYWHTPRLRAVFALSWSIAAASSTVIVNTVLIARQQFGLGDSGVALFYAMAGGGSMAAALLLPRLLPDDSRDRSVMSLGCALLATGLLLSWGGLHWLPLALLGWAVIGVGLSMAQTPIGRLLRRSCHAGDRPALFSAQFALSHGCWLVCYPLAGTLAAYGGLALALPVMAGVAVVGMLVAGLVWPSPDHGDLPHHHAAEDHDHLHSHGDDHHSHQHQPEVAGMHSHPHSHAAHQHRHPYVIDRHHQDWPG